MSNHVALGSTIAIGSPVPQKPEIGTDATKSTTTTTFFTNLSKGSVVVATNSSVVSAVIKGNEVTGAIINVGFNINVINKKTCDTLGIWEWEPCPLCLRMADTNSVRRTRLIQNVEITIVGHVFRISAFVLN